MKLTHKKIWAYALNYTSFKRPIEPVQLMQRICENHRIKGADQLKVMEVVTTEYKKYHAKALLTKTELTYYNFKQKTDITSNWDSKFYEYLQNDQLKRRLIQHNYIAPKTSEYECSKHLMRYMNDINKPN